MKNQFIAWILVAAVSACAPPPHGGDAALASSPLKLAKYDIMSQDCGARGGFFKYMNTTNETHHLTINVNNDADYCTISVEKTIVGGTPKPMIVVECAAGGSQTGAGTTTVANGATAQFDWICGKTEDSADKCTGTIDVHLTGTSAGTPPPPPTPPTPKTDPKPDPPLDPIYDPIGALPELWPGLLVQKNCMLA